MISGEQSSQGIQGHQGQMRSRSKSGTFGSTVTSLSRSDATTEGSLIGPRNGSGATGTGFGDGIGVPPVMVTMSTVGTGSGVRNLRLGFSFVTGEIFSISKGSSAHSRNLHHHHGHQPQHQRNLMAKLPLASVIAGPPTWETEDHHQKKSTSKARTSAPGAGLPFAQTTRPVITKVRHQRNQRIHHAAVTLIGVKVSEGLSPH